MRMSIERVTRREFRCTESSNAIWLEVQTLLLCRKVTLCIKTKIVCFVEVYPNFALRIDLSQLVESILRFRDSNDAMQICLLVLIEHDIDCIEQVCVLPLVVFTCVDDNVVSDVHHFNEADDCCYRYSCLASSTTAWNELSCLILHRHESKRCCHSFLRLWNCLVNELEECIDVLANLFSMFLKRLLV